MALFGRVIQFRVQLLDNRPFLLFVRRVGEADSLYSSAPLDIAAGQMAEDPPEGFAMIAIDRLEAETPGIVCTRFVFIASCAVAVFCHGPYSW